MKNFKLLICLSLIFIFNSCNKESVSTNKMAEGLIQKRHQTYKQPAISNACNLTISIDPCFLDVPEYMKAFDKAIDLYNNISNVGINMSIVSQDADIHFDCYYLQCFNGDGIEGGWAGEFYDGNDETNSIYLNANMPEVEECCMDFNLCNMTGLIVHEIGHVIGLDHTESPDGVHIPETPHSDSKSLFNGGNFCKTGCKFSHWDVKALQIVHPPCNCGALPNFKILYDGPTCLNENETFSIEAIPSTISLTVIEWTVSDGIQILNSDSQYVTIKAIQAGPARVCAKVKDVCGNEVTDCFFFHVMPDVNCADDDGGGALGGLNPK